MITNYQHEEKEYVGKRECAYCDFYDLVDITAWKEVEYWYCRKCKHGNETALW